MRTPLILTSCVALALIAAPAAKASSATELAAKYVAWRGGAAFLRLKGVQAAGQITMGGLTGAVKRWTIASGTSAEQRDFGAFVTAEAVSPTARWMRQPGGQVQTLARSDAEAEANLARASLGPPDRIGGATLSRTAPEMLDGKMLGVLRLSFHSGPPVELLLDENTGELAATRVVGGGGQVIRFSDWRPVAGVMMAFAEAQSGGGPPARLTLSRADPVAAAPESATRRPAAPRNFSFAGTATSSGPVAFTLWDGTRIFVPLAVNGQLVEALLDTAAAGSVLDATLAAGLDRAGSGDFKVTGVTGTAAARLARNVDLAIGEARVHEAAVTVMDLSAIGRALGRPVAAIVGKDVLESLVVDLDFASNRLELKDPAAFRGDEGMARLTAEPTAGGLRAIAATIPGAGAGLFHIDFGNPTPLLVYPSARGAVLTATAARSSWLVSGVGGLAPADTLTLPWLKLGRAALADVPAYVLQPGAGRLSPVGVTGNLGLPVFQRFHVILDFPHDRIWLAPLSRPPAEFGRDRSGIVATREPAGLRVRMVAPHSPAEAVGLSVGDVIVAVNGQPISDDYVASGLSRWRQDPHQARAVLKLANGALRSLQLRPYY